MPHEYARARRAVPTRDLTKTASSGALRPWNPRPAGSHPGTSTASPGTASALHYRVFGRPAIHYYLPEMARTSAGISDALRHRLEALAAQVRRERAASARSLGLGKLSRAEQAELLSALGRAGLEHTGQAIRVPLGEQVRECLARAGAQGLREAVLAREVKGARSAAELRLTLQTLLQEGAIIKLLDEDGMRLASSAARALTSAELDQLAALAKRLGVLAQATRAGNKPPRPTLARSALEAPRALLNQLAGGRATAQQAPVALAPERSADDAAPDRAPAVLLAARAGEAAPGQPAAAGHAVHQALHATAAPDQPAAAGHAVQQALHAAFLVAPAASGLIRVPEVIRALERLYPRAALVAAASTLARRGEIELRPEASIRRFPEAERARCPLAPDGTPLSNARVTQPSGGQP
jgi:hypothetical protein